MAKLGWVHVVTEGNLSLFRNPQNASVVYLEDPDTGMRTALKDFLVRGNSVVVKLPKNVKKGGLVFAFANRGGYEVFANGQALEVLSNDLGLVAVNIDDDVSEVALRYKSRFAVVSLVLCLLGIFILFMLHVSTKPNIGVAKKGY